MLLPLGAAAGVLFATSTYGSKATTARVPLFQVTVPRTCTTPPRGCRRWPSFYVTGRYSSFCQPEAQPSQRSLLATTNRRSQTAAVAVAGRLKLLCTSQQQQEHQSRFVGGEGDDGGGLLDIAGEANDVGRGNLEEYTSRSSWGSSSEVPVSTSVDEVLVSPVLIKVIGVGGGGGNAVDGMINTATRDLAGVEFVTMNTDTQALTKSRAKVKMALGSNITRGLGAGGKPEVGQAAAKESLPEIKKLLADADMVFVTAGMGGGTGTGAAPVIAEAARDLGCLTVAVVTEPFSFEGRQRSKQAAAGLQQLREAADTVLVVANDRLLEIVPGRMTMQDAFLVADDVLRQGVIGTSEIIVRPGLMNVDFADVRQVIKSSGTALIGIGTGTGKTRAEDAAVGAMCSPLLDFPIDEARGVVFNIVGGPDMSLMEVNAAARIIHNNVHPDANIIVGALVDERCGQQVSVTVLATGFEATDPRDGGNRGSRFSRDQQAASGQLMQGAAGGAPSEEGTPWPQPNETPLQHGGLYGQTSGQVRDDYDTRRQGNVRSPHEGYARREEDLEWREAKPPTKRTRGMFQRLFRRQG